MADYGIIFSDMMVAALLDGRKTQTRRLPVPPWPDIRVGDRLYVREAFAAYRKGDAGSEPSAIGEASFALMRDGYHQHRSGLAVPGLKPLSRYAKGAFDNIRWRPSIHMPRWASRLTLEVTAQRAQPLQKITDKDARAEGIFQAAKYWRWERPHGNVVKGAGYERPSHAYAALWERLHGHESWHANPEVIALTFNVHATNIDHMEAQHEVLARAT